jgi:hypothetical protein
MQERATQSRGTAHCSSRTCALRKDFLEAIFYQILLLEDSDMPQGIFLRVVLVLLRNVRLVLRCRDRESVCMVLVVSGYTIALNKT